MAYHLERVAINEAYRARVAACFDGLVSSLILGEEGKEQGAKVFDQFRKNLERLRWARGLALKMIAKQT